MRRPPRGRTSPGPRSPCGQRRPWRYSPPEARRATVPLPRSPGSTPRGPEPPGSSCWSSVALRFGWVAAAGIPWSGI